MGWEEKAKGGGGRGVLEEFQETASLPYLTANARVQSDADAGSDRL